MLTSATWRTSLKRAEEPYPKVRSACEDRHPLSRLRESGQRDGRQRDARVAVHTGSTIFSKQITNLWIAVDRMGIATGLDCVVQCDQSGVGESSVASLTIGMSKVDVCMSPPINVLLIPYYENIHSSPLTNHPKR